MVKSTENPAYSELRALLSATRRDKGVTQAELAARLGRPQPFVSEIERGVRRIDIIEFCAIMRALGVDPQVAFKAMMVQLPDTFEI